MTAPATSTVEVYLRDGTGIRAVAPTTQQAKTEAIRALAAHLMEKQ